MMQHKQGIKDREVRPTQRNFLLPSSLSLKRLLMRQREDRKAQTQPEQDGHVVPLVEDYSRLTFVPGRPISPYREKRTACRFQSLSHVYPKIIPENLFSFTNQTHLISLGTLYSWKAVLPLK